MQASAPLPGRPCGDARPLVAHVLHRFDTGGLENGVVNLLNHWPDARFRHAVVALDRIEPGFAARVRRPDVEFIALHKAPGQTLWLYPRLLALFRRLRPTVVHTRNLAALECQVPAWLAGVPVRIHGEHGRDMGDLDGSHRGYRLVRRLHRPFVQRYVALTEDLAAYLRGPIGVPQGRVQCIVNGVDSQRFRPATAGREPIAGCPFSDAGLWLVGSIGRMQAVKNQTALAQAFVRLLELRPDLRERLRLVLVGEGPLRAQAHAVLAAAGLDALAWLPGERDDVPELLRGLDAFALPSLAEGMSNTILEAMASGLPVLATDVGGNRDLVVPGGTGELVSAADVDALATGLAAWADDPCRAAALGRAGRARVEREFSLERMVAAYHALYLQGLAGAAVPALQH